MTRQPERHNISFTYDAEFGVVEKLVKSAVVTRRGNGENTWTMISDEPRVIGGDNSAPPPVAFLTASLGFCLMTHLVQYTEMMRLRVERHTVRVSASWHQSGSVLQGTIRGHCDGIEVDIEVDSPEAEDRIDALLANSVGGCFVMQTLRHPVAVSSTASVNGARRRIEASGEEK